MSALELTAYILETILSITLFLVVCLTRHMIFKREVRVSWYAACMWWILFAATLSNMVTIQVFYAFSRPYPTEKQVPYLAFLIDSNNTLKTLLLYIFPVVYNQNSKVIEKKLIPHSTTYVPDFSVSKKIIYKIVFGFGVL